MLTHNGLPTALIAGDRDHRVNVAHIQDVWCIDDEWWRAPIARRYYQLVLETGALATVYHDLTTDAWHEQRY